jgi:phosphatidylethanolamine-binding protein (PEBP) family uncharacterized protein
MKNRSKICVVTLFSLLGLFTFYSCDRTDNPENQASDFMLFSAEIGTDSLLPKDYTCDGTSSTLPIEWSGAPEATVSFALIMHHEASPTDIHWYWVLYNIPVTVKSIPKNASGIGILGTNSVNDKTEYAPPCSQGPGLKAYTYTVYALSANPVINVPANEVTRDVLLLAIKDITLSSAQMTVYYSRSGK